MAYSNRGGIYLFKRDFEQALSDFNTSIDLDPTNTKSYSNRGNFYFFRGNFESALADFDEAIKLTSESPNTYFTRGIICLCLQEWERARKDMASARDLGMNIINVFQSQYKSIANFEKKNNVQIPKNIREMLDRQ